MKVVIDDHNHDVKTHIKPTAETNTTSGGDDGEAYVLSRSRALSKMLQHSHPRNFPVPAVVLVLVLALALCLCVAQLKLQNSHLAPAMVPALVLVLMLGLGPNRGI
jgi:amino acid transporter